MLEVWLDLGELEDLRPTPCRFHRTPHRRPAGLVEHHCGVGERGGFIQRLHEGTWCGHVLEHT